MATCSNFLKSFAFLLPLQHKDRRYVRAHQHLCIFYLFDILEFVFWCDVCLSITVCVRDQSPPAGQLCSPQMFDPVAGKGESCQSVSCILPLSLPLLKSNRVIALQKFVSFTFSYLLISLLLLVLLHLWIPFTCSSVFLFFVFSIRLRERLHNKSFPTNPEFHYELVTHAVADVLQQIDRLWIASLDFLE